MQFLTLSNSSLTKKFHVRLYKREVKVKIAAASPIFPPQSKIKIEFFLFKRIWNFWKLNLIRIWHLLHHHYHWKKRRRRRKLPPLESNYDIYQLPAWKREREIIMSSRHSGFYADYPLLRIVTPALSVLPWRLMTGGWGLRGGGRGGGGGGAWSSAGRVDTSGASPSSSWIGWADTSSVDALLTDGWADLREMRRNGAAGKLARRLLAGLSADPDGRLARHWATLTPLSFRILFVSSNSWCSFSHFLWNVIRSKTKMVSFHFKSNKLCNLFCFIYGPGIRSKFMFELTSLSGLVLTRIKIESISCRIVKRNGAHTRK